MTNRERLQLIQSCEHAAQHAEGVIAGLIRRGGEGVSVIPQIREIVRSSRLQAASHRAYDIRIKARARAELIGCQSRSYTYPDGECTECGAFRWDHDVQEVR